LQESEYLNIYRNEDTHWWYQGTHSLIVTSIKKFLPTEDIWICDAGCGTGGLLKRLKREGFLNSYGFDSSPYAIEQLRKRKDISRRIWQGDVEQLALRNSSFDVITSIDVLYHSNVHSEEQALKEFFRVLKPNGICILQYAAFEFLRGSHDIVVMTRRRSRIIDVERNIKEAGFKIDVCNYRNIWIFPMLLFWRTLSRFWVGRKKMNGSSDLFRFPKIINTLFYIVAMTENYLLSKIRFPFGTSMFCIARKE